MRCETVMQLLLRREVNVKAEAQWRELENDDDENDKNNDEYDDDMTDTARMKFLSKLLRQLLLEQEIIINKAKAQHELTTWQLAASDRHVAVQRLLE